MLIRQCVVHARGRDQLQPGQEVLTHDFSARSPGYIKNYAPGTREWRPIRPRGSLARVALAEVVEQRMFFELRRLVLLADST